jgi:hypothetical protein
LVQLGTKRNALGLYVGLLVLPTIVLGALHWRVLRKNHQDALAAVPEEASDAARRLSDAIARRVAQLVEHEYRRPFYEYSRSYFPPGTIGTELAFFPSPLIADAAPEGVLGWFEFHNNFFSKQPPEIYGGQREQEGNWSAARDGWIAATQALRELDERELPDTFLRMQQLRLRHGPAAERVLPYPVLAVNLSPERDFNCLRSSLPELRGLEEADAGHAVSSALLPRCFRAGMRGGDTPGADSRPAGPAQHAQLLLGDAQLDLSPAGLPDRRRMADPRAADAAGASGARPRAATAVLAR